MTDNAGTVGEPKGRVLYDGECAFCTGLARQFGAALRRRGFELAPLTERRSQMELATSDGRILGGADAVIELARQIWWGWPIWVFAQAPGSRPLLRAAYRWI